MEQKEKVFKRQTLLVVGEQPNPKREGSGYGLYVVRWSIDGEVMPPRFGSCQYYTRDGVKCLSGMKGLTINDMAHQHKNWAAIRAALTTGKPFKADVMPLDASAEAPVEA